MAKPIKASKRLISRLHTLLRYDPMEGQLYWNEGYWRSEGGKNPRAGHKAGFNTHTNNGKRKESRIIVDGRIYACHRIAYLLVKGNDIPAGMEIDHRDGDGWNYRWENLRLCTRSQNNINKRSRTPNTRSGVLGVVYVHGYKGKMRPKPWQARIKVKGKFLSLGTYATVEEAAVARREGERRYYGEFNSRL